jgi:NAD(P)-dependent dehydrogenase (short-subunit alcohol dehydrogenase family)
MIGPRPWLAVVLLVSIATAARWTSAPAQSAPRPAQQAVLVTGASTGIGRKITEVLAGKGYFVYAGARKEQDLRELDAIANVKSIKLDVTVNDEVGAAVRTIEAAGRGLYGIVNNAGVAIVGPLIEVEEEDLKFQFDVNVYGPYRVTKAFSKLLIASKGRVTTIGSISGILSGPLLGAYSMSKHAVEAYTDALAAEMARVNVKASVIEPGNYSSEMGKNVVRRMEERGTKIEGSLYEKELRVLMSSVSAESRDPEPDDVAQAVLHALFDPNPKARYLVVPNQRQAESTIRKAILELVQLNEGHRFSYPRDSLVAMLDQALARSR